MFQHDRTPTTCHFCPRDAVYQVVYQDEEVISGACLDHLGWVQDLAERTDGGRAFCPVYVGRIAQRELVPA